LPAAAEARAEDEHETVVTAKMSNLTSVALSTSSHTTNYWPPITQHHPTTL